MLNNYLNNINNNIIIYLKKKKKKMKKIIFNLKKDLLKIFTNKINIEILSNLKINYLGKLVLLNKISNILMTNDNKIIIRPYEINNIKNIEKSIKNANLGFNPIIFKNHINIILPSLNYEKRIKIFKIIKLEIENSKIKIRNIKNKINNFIKNNKLSKDDKYKIKNYIQYLINKYINIINIILKKKKKEILINN